MEALKSLTLANQQKQQQINLIKYLFPLHQLNQAAINELKKLKELSNN